jgi:hypothetical protein
VFTLVFMSRLAPVFARYVETRFTFIRKMKRRRW